jgi:hypothetical protein
MNLRKTLVLVAIGVGYVSASMPATLRNVDVSRRRNAIASPPIHLAASPEAIYKVLMD